MAGREEAEQKRQAALARERTRVASMRTFEQQAVLEQYGSSEFPALASGDPLVRGTVLICGVDEAGRGPLAGPVAAGACILPADHDILYLNDSKKLTPKKREELYSMIVRDAVAWNVGIVGPERIDEINILQADYEAMRIAVAGLRDGREHTVPYDTADTAGRCRESVNIITPAVLVNDAVTIPGIELPQCNIVKADAKCLSVSAASILAKVTRDRIMEEYDGIYPEYHFAQNKGYGTKLHIEALRQYGPCPIHRRTFIGHFV